jgi:hypothetical protein
MSKEDTPTMTKDNGNTLNSQDVKMHIATMPATVGEQPSLEFIASLLSIIDTSEQKVRVHPKTVEHEITAVTKKMHALKKHGDASSLEIQDLGK